MVRFHPAPFGKATDQKNQEEVKMKNFERTPETIEINNALQIVKLEGNIKFLSKSKDGYLLPSGYCFLHPQKGYFAFKGDETPYIPAGGRKALESIVRDGGFIDFDASIWLHPFVG